MLHSLFLSPFVELLHRRETFIQSEILGNKCFHLFWLLVNMRVKNLEIPRFDIREIDAGFFLQRLLHASRVTHMHPVLLQSILNDLLRNRHIHNRSVLQFFLRFRNRTQQRCLSFCKRFRSRFRIQVQFLATLRFLFDQIQSVRRCEIANWFLNRFPNFFARTSLDLRALLRLRWHRLLLIIVLLTSVVVVVLMLLLIIVVVVIISLIRFAVLLLTRSETTCWLLSSCCCCSSCSCCSSSCCSCRSCSFILIRVTWTWWLRRTESWLWSQI